MKRISFIVLSLALATFLTGCGGPAANTGNAVTTANSNANAKPAAAAPTADALMALDKQANEAWMKGDTAHFEGMLNDKFIRYMNGARSGKQDEIKMIAGTKCDVKSWSLDDGQMIKISDDVYVNTYKGTFDGTCTFDGKTEKIPSPMRAASVWLRSGDKWTGAYHNETAIVDPKAPPPPSAPVKKEEPKKDDKAASNSNMVNGAPAPARPAGSINTDALVAIHQKGWEAFKAKDAKWFNDNIASTFAFVDPLGNYHGSKAVAVRTWTETMKCEGITTVKVSDGLTRSLTPTVEILTLKGTADGTCDGQKNGDLYQTAIYAKEGDAWKLAFMFETPGA